MRISTLLSPMIGLSLCRGISTLNNSCPADETITGVALPVFLNNSSLNPDYIRQDERDTTNFYAWTYRALSVAGVGTIVMAKRNNPVEAIVIALATTTLGEICTQGEPITKAIAAGVNTQITATSETIVAFATKVISLGGYTLEAAAKGFVTGFITTLLPAASGALLNKGGNVFLRREFQASQTDILIEVIVISAISGIITTFTNLINEGSILPQICWVFVSWLILSDPLKDASSALEELTSFRNQGKGLKQNFEVKIAKASTDNKICGICREIIAKNQVIGSHSALNNKEHLYHLSCMISWLKTTPNRPTCPECRATIIFAKK